MASITIRNLPDDVHRAIRVRAAHHGRSTEAEVRDILQQASKPVGRMKLGTLLVSIASEAGGLTDQEHALFERSKTPAAPMSFDE